MAIHLEKSTPIMIMTLAIHKTKYQFNKTLKIIVYCY